MAGGTRAVLRGVAAFVESDEAVKPNDIEDPIRNFKGFNKSEKQGPVAEAAGKKVANEDRVCIDSKVSGQGPSICGH